MGSKTFFFFSLVQTGRASRENWLSCSLALRSQVDGCVLFIGTRFSNLYPAVDTPAEAV